MPFIDLPDRIPGLRAQARSDRPWYRIVNQAADEAEVMLYDEIGGWYGATADEFIGDLRGITASNILLRVNSPGGSVTEGIAIANALRSHPANVTVQVDGIAASIASVIAMAGDQIRMMPNALLMVHEASGFCVGDAAEMIKMGEVLDLISDNIASAYAARAGGTEAEWRQVMKNETWYRGEEAVEAGLADEVVPLPQRGEDAPDAEMHARFDLAAYGYAGPKVPEKPKPGPPPVKATAEEPAPTLVISIEEVLDAETVAKLRDAVRERGAEAAAKEFGGTITATPATVPAEPVGTGPDGTAAGTGALPPEAPVPAAPKPEAKTDPEWAGIFAHLTTPKPDAWAAAFSHLTAQPASSATES